MPDFDWHGQENCYDLAQLVAAFAILAVTTAAPADNLKFNNTASTIELVGIKADGSHSGGFKKFAGTVNGPKDDFSRTRFTIEIQTESLFSDNEKLTALLKSPDVFDVHSHPTAKFTSKMIRPISGDTADTHLVIGELTLHGVTKTVKIPLNATTTPTGFALTGVFVIHRKDFGMAGAEKQINSDIKVKVSIQTGK